jgi:hypothetical protein
LFESSKSIRSTLCVLGGFARNLGLRGITRKDAKIAKNIQSYVSFIDARVFYLSKQMPEMLRFSFASQRIGDAVRLTGTARILANFIQRRRF